MTDPASKITAPHQVGRYRMRGRIARGGMASVYLASLGGAHGFEQFVAIKLMHPHLAEDRRFVNMFLDEAKVAQNLQHPNVCAVRDFGEEDGTPYLVMEYLHGETLGVIARAGWEASTLPVWLPARSIADAARGLHAAHELLGSDGTLKNLVHRDVSPSNVMVLYDGFSKIMDFGVVQADNREGHTETGEVKGKFSYMSPEQLRSMPLDRRSDVWSLGVILWETTLGKRLFRGDNPADTALAVVEKEIPDPRDLRPDYPDALAEVVMGALRRDLSHRTATARELADGLERYLVGTGRVVGPDQVAEWLSTNFEERRARKDALLTQDAAPVEITVTAEPDPSESLGGAFAHSYIGQTEQARSGPPWALIAMGAIAALLGVIVVVLLTRGPGEAVSETEAVSEAEAEAEAEAAAAAEAEAAAAAEAEAEAAAEAAAEAEAEAEAEAAAAAAAELAAAAESEAEAEGEAAAAPDGLAPGERAVAPRRPEGRSGRAGARVAAVSAEPGTLNLLAIPAAEVRLGGRALGTTPLLGIELPAGTHRLTLTPRGGGEARTVTVVIRAGERTSRSVSLNAE